MYQNNVAYEINQQKYKAFLEVTKNSRKNANEVNKPNTDDS